MLSSKPVATLVSVTSTLLGVLTVLAGTGVLSGRAAAWVAGGILVCNAVLGILAHGNVTPVAAPRARDGRRLVPMQQSNRLG